MNKMRTDRMKYGYINIATTMVCITGHPAGAETKEKLQSRF